MSSREAMAAKARAMFGERLGADAYEALLQKKERSEIIRYLKTQPLYAEAFQGVNEQALHRGQLEVLLRMSVYGRLRKLLRYGSREDGRFLIGAGLNTELEMILMTVRSLFHPDPESRAEMITELPLYMDEYTSFELSGLAEVNTYAGLQELLKNTPYAPVLQRHQRAHLEEIDESSLEYDLRMAYYRRLLALVQRDTGGEAGRELRRLVQMRAELNNITYLYRLKKYFHADADTIRRSLIPLWCLFSQAEVEKLIRSGSEEDVLAALQKTYHAYLPRARFTYIENYVERMLYHICRQYLETSVHPALILMSYLDLSSIEIHNLINIVEGARYQVANDRIRPLLVY